jgi:hypothetical protein
MRFPCLFPAACLLAAALPSRAQPAPLPPGEIAQAEIAPSTASVLLAAVSLAVPTLTHSHAEFVSSYAVTVFPFFFFNEQGRFHVLLPDADLTRLNQGQAIDFTGQAVRDDGAGRLVQGHAVPSGPNDGQVKIRVYYTKHIVLVFNTTYHLIGSIK